MDPSLKDRLTASLGGLGCGFADVRLEFIEAARVSYRGGKLEVASTQRDVGGIVRVLEGGRWGTSSFNDLGDLRARLDEARACALAAPEGDLKLAPAEPLQDVVPAPMVRDWRQVPLADKRSLVERYSHLALAEPRIRDAQVTLAERFSQCYYASTEGAFIYQERPHAVLNVTAMACDDGQVQQASRGKATRYDHGELHGQEEMVLEAASRARALLAAPPVRGGTYTVILGPRMAGLFAHEAFGHLSEADFIADNPEAQKMMTLGRRFGRPILNIVDDGSVPGRRGFIPYDDEGVRTRRTYLVREGLLVGRLHHRESAGLMGEAVTGNARATYYRHPPIVRMTNTMILPGEASFEEMISDVKLGVYAVFAGGGQTFLENFAFASGGSYMIRDGKVAELVRDVNFGGNLFATLANIDAVGSDLTWLESGSSCGKGQEMMLPVGMASPHVRVQGVLMGGR